MAMALAMAYFVNFGHKGPTGAGGKGCRGSARNGNENKRNRTKTKRIPRKCSSKSNRPANAIYTSQKKKDGRGAGKTKRGKATMKRIHDSGKLNAAASDNDKAREAGRGGRKKQNEEGKL